MGPGWVLLGPVPDGCAMRNAQQRARMPSRPCAPRATGARRGGHRGLPGAHSTTAMTQHPTTDQRTPQPGRFCINLNYDFLNSEVSVLISVHLPVPTRDRPDAHTAAVRAFPAHSRSRAASWMSAMEVEPTATPVMPLDPV